jgi:hypothetical protein
MHVLPPQAEAAHERPARTACRVPDFPVPIFQVLLIVGGAILRTPI